MLRVDIITIFPQMFGPTLSEGMLRIAQEKGELEVHVHDLRDYTADKHRSIDDRPYGGGPGMVMMPGPVFEAVEDVTANTTAEPRLILLTPQGRTFDQALARELAADAHLVLICGRYEGFDERIRTGLPVEEVSIGDYVLTGGELPAAVLVDAVARLLPGVLGHEDSSRCDSFSGEGWLDCPQYTRPAEFRGMAVPEVLLSGHHKEIEDWRREHSRERTLRRRPDLAAKISSQEERSRDT